MQQLSEDAVTVYLQLLALSGCWQCAEGLPGSGDVWTALPLSPQVHEDQSPVCTSRQPVSSGPGVNMNRPHVNDPLSS